MFETLIIIAVLAIVIMGWSKIDAGLDWAGKRIGETTDVVSDATRAASKQTARALIISHGSLQDTALEATKKAAERATAKATFLDSLDETQKEEVKEATAYIADLLER